MAYQSIIQEYSTHDEGNCFNICLQLTCSNKKLRSKIINGETIKDMYFDNVSFKTQDAEEVSTDSIVDPKEESLYVAGIQGNLGQTDLLVYLLESIIAGIIDDLPTNEESYPDQEEGEIIFYACNLT